MVKKRLIFTLLYDLDNFMLSRNFRLQKVGDLSWLKEYYDFNSITNSIDELVVLNVERNKDKNILKFSENLSVLVENCFIPVAAGGGIKSMDDAYNILNAGADKLILNTALYRQKNLVREIVKTFGSQCLVASIDFKNENKEKKIFSENGAFEEPLSFKEAIINAEELGAGEIYLTSMTKDGTGQGIDVDSVFEATTITNLPIIASGGIGNFKQIFEVIRVNEIDAISTANLFNFMSDALSDARLFVEENGISLAKWQDVKLVKN